MTKLTVKSYISGIINNDKNQVSILETVKSSRDFNMFLTDLCIEAKDQGMTQAQFTTLSNRVKKWISRNNDYIVKGNTAKIIDNLSGFKLEVDNKDGKMIAVKTISAKALHDKAEKAEKKEQAASDKQEKEDRQKLVAEIANSLGTVDTISMSDLVKDDIKMANILALYITSNGLKKFDKLIISVLPAETGKEVTQKDQKTG